MTRGATHFDLLDFLCLALFHPGVSLGSYCEDCIQYLSAMRDLWACNGSATFDSDYSVLRAALGWLITFFFSGQFVDNGSPPGCCESRMLLTYIWVVRFSRGVRLVV